MGKRGGLRLLHESVQMDATNVSTAGWVGSGSLVPRRSLGTRTKGRRINIMHLHPFLVEKHPSAMRSLSLALLAVGLALPAGRAADKVTLDDLLQQMTDLSKLAEYPDPPYVAKQFSSYDRASEAPGKESWFANADRGFMLYDGVVKEKTPYFNHAPMREGPEDGSFAAGTKVGFSPTHKRVGDFVWVYATAADGRAIDGKIPQGYIDKDAMTLDPQGHVLAEMDGPGCVVNIWSANPDDAGNIRIYLDEAKEPVIEAPLTSCWAASGRRRSTARRRRRSPTRSPANGRAASTCISPSPTPSTARSLSISRTFIITSITGPIRRGRKWRHSSSKTLEEKAKEVAADRRDTGRKARAFRRRGPEAPGTYGQAGGTLDGLPVIGRTRSCIKTFWAR